LEWYNGGIGFMKRRSKMTDGYDRYLDDNYQDALEDAIAEEQADGFKLIDVDYFGTTEWDKDGEAYYTLMTVGLDYDDQWVDEYGLYMESFTIQIHLAIQHHFDDDHVDHYYVAEIFPKFWSSSGPTGPAICEVTAAKFDDVVAVVMAKYKELVIDEDGPGRLMVDAMMEKYRGN